MPATLYTISDLEQGGPWSRSIQWNDSTGALVKLSGYGARMAFRVAQAVTSAIVLGPFTAGAGITLGGSTYNIVISITALQTAAATVFSGYYDFFLDPSGVEDGASFPLFYGSFTMRPRVTA